MFFNTKPEEQLPEHIDTRLVWPWHLPPTIWIQNLYVAIRTKLELVVFNKIIKCRRKAHIIHTFSISETHKLAKQGKLGTSDFRVTRGVSIICKSSSWKWQIYDIIRQWTTKPYMYNAVNQGQKRTWTVTLKECTFAFTVTFDVLAHRITGSITNSFSSIS